MIGPFLGRKRCSPAAEAGNENGVSQMPLLTTSARINAATAATAAIQGMPCAAGVRVNRQPLREPAIARAPQQFFDLHSRIADRLQAPFRILLQAPAEQPCADRGIRRREAPSSRGQS